MSPRPQDYEEDDYEDVSPRRRPPRDGGISSLIPYHNPKSLVAYYCGVFSLIPCLGLILGPIALIFGILALKYANLHPTAKGTGHAITGIVLGSLASLANLVGLVFVVMGIALAR